MWSAIAARVCGAAAPLDAHIGRHGIDYLQFAFRWMNNLLMRELPLHCTIRLWDTYLSETDGFASFHLYVCAAFLTSWSELLMRQRDFQASGGRGGRWYRVVGRSQRGGAISRENR